jgi:negative regulator of sigma E activity
MSRQPDQSSGQLQLLSALMDGEADETAVAQLCAAWRDDPAARRAWHAWHLIGDVLRSDDLASQAPHDAALLASLRAALVAEPSRAEARTDLAARMGWRRGGGGGSPRGAGCGGGHRPPTGA